MPATHVPTSISCFLLQKFRGKALISGKDLSIRNIDLLANGFFKGSDNIRQQIKNGNITWGLNQLQKTSSRINECTTAEQGMLKDLESVQRYMQKITCKIRDDDFGNTAFHAQADILAEGIINIADNFMTAVRGLYDRCEQV